MVSSALLQVFLAWHAILKILAKKGRNQRRSFAENTSFSHENISYSVFSLDHLVDQYNYLDYVHMVARDYNLRQHEFVLFINC